MVKFINFKVVGGVEDGAGTLNPGVNGNNLLLIERIIDVDVGTGQAGIGFQSMFENCKNFNQDISGWNVGNGPGFSSMFYNAQAFNQDLSSWDMSKATTVRSMFQRASTFNQDLSGWNAPLVSDCRDFDDLATSWTLPKPSFPASSFCP